MLLDVAQRQAEAMAAATQSEQVLASLPDAYVQAVQSIRKRLPASLALPVWGIVCGSGLSGLADRLTERVLIDYDTIPVRIFGRCSDQDKAYQSTAAGSSLCRASLSPPCKVTNPRLPLDTFHPPRQRFPSWPPWDDSISMKATRPKRPSSLSG